MKGLIDGIILRLGWPIKLLVIESKNGLPHLIFGWDWLGLDLGFGLRLVIKILLLFISRDAYLVTLSIVHCPLSIVH